MKHEITVSSFSNNIVTVYVGRCLCGYKFETTSWHTKQKLLREHCGPHISRDNAAMAAPTG